MKPRTNSICALVASALLASTTCNLNDHQEAAVAPPRVTSAAAGVDVSFSYLSLSLPIGFQFVDRLVSFSNTEEANNLLKRIKSIYPVNSLAFMLNTTEFLGTYLRYPIFS